MLVKWKKLVIGVLVLLVLIAAAGAGSAAASEDASQDTQVSLTVAQLTITVDMNIAGWGYAVSDNPGVVHHSTTYVAIVEPGSTVQIAVDLPLSGWYLSCTGGTIGGTYHNLVTVPDVTGTKSVDIQAHEYDKVTVTFDSNGGSAVASQSVYPGQTVNEPPVPTKTGYIFAAWYTDNGTFQNKWDFADVVNADMTLYAKWLAVPCTVTFNADGGEPEPEAVDVEYGEKVTKPSPDPVKTGYVFGGWYYNSEMWDFENDLVQSDITLTAHWTPVTYYVRFNANGGSGSMDDQQFVYDVPQNLTVNAFTRSSYTFQGWAESATGSVVYRNHAEVKNLSSVQDDVVDLYAVWRYNGGGGGSGSSSKVVPKIVDEITIEVDFQKIITIPAIDEDGNYVVLPIEQLIMTDPVTGVVYIGDKTEEYDSLTIVPSLKETAQFITEYRVETIAEALAAGIPVYENYIGGNGHAPVLVEDMSETIDPVKFYQVIEITTDVTGGSLQEIIFKVPLAELTEQGFTTTDVVLYHGVKEDSERIWYPLVTTLEWCDETYAYYAAKTDGASPFGILFLKDSTCMVPVSPVSPDEPVTPVATPVPVIGVLAGLLGAGAAVMMKRRM